MRFVQLKKLPRGCRSERMSQSNSPLMSYPRLQVSLSSPPEKPQQRDTRLQNEVGVIPLQQDFIEIQIGALAERRSWAQVQSQCKSMETQLTGVHILYMCELYHD